MGLCMCFWRNSSFEASTHFISRHYSKRSLYLTGVLVRFSHQAFLAAIYLHLCWVLNCHVNVTFIFASYGSLYLLSSLSLVRLCSALFLVATNVIQACVQLEKSYLLQCYKVHIWANAYIFASELAAGVLQGLNVTYLSALVCSKIFCLYIAGIGLILNGRIIGGHSSRRFVVNALCVGSFSSRYRNYYLLRFIMVSDRKLRIVAKIETFMNDSKKKDSWS
eukprot:UN0019